MPDPTLWCIHIPGPDEVYARASLEDATCAALEFNAAARRLFARLPYPGWEADMEATMAANTAVVAVWPHSPESHAVALAGMEGTGDTGVCLSPAGLAAAREVAEKGEAPHG